MTGKCGTCRFWEPNLKSRSINGECHIRAPQVVADADREEPQTAWPRTLHIDWCGEHEPKPTDIDKPTDTTEGGAA
jgi:hypothetical protein